nr:adenosylcobinamide-phosphate synthase CbiB [Bacillus sp. FJAT-45037]
MVLHHLMAITLAIIMDRIIGDPRNFPHPVVYMGKLISSFETNWNLGKYRLLKGWTMMLILIVISGGVVFLIVDLAYSVHFALGIVTEAWIISTTIATKGLKQAAQDVMEPLGQGKVEVARTSLSYIVGRDTNQLDEREMTRATIETVAENTSDGITAPLFFAFIGGAPFAMVYRAVNTGDSMVGYKNERFKTFGYAAAKLDDALNWIPSRLTGFLMVVTNQPVKNRTKRECVRILIRDAKKHVSPNSGWGEAAVASLLGVQLGGKNTYFGQVSNRAKMGDAHFTPHHTHIAAAICIMERTVFSFTLFLWMIGGVWIVVT